MSNITFLNCPFCGSDNPIIQHVEPHKHLFVDLPDHEGSYTIECRGCNLGFIEATKEEAIAAWNRRAPEAGATSGELCGNALTWTKVADRLPDSETTVMLFDPGASESVWSGYLDGEIWRYVDAMPATPTHWSEMPAGPQEVDTK